MIQDSPTLIYDGHCPFCRNTVKLLRRWRRPGALDMVAADTPLGSELLDRFGLPADDLQAVVLVRGDRWFQGSDAVWRAATRLRWPYRALAQIRWFPRFLREAVYGFIAGHRDRLS